MYIILVSYIAGILISEKMMSLSVMILALTAYIILYINLPQKKIVLTAGLLLFVIGCVYPILMLRETRQTHFQHGSIINIEAEVIKVNESNTIIKASGKKYIIYGQARLMPGDIISITARYMEFENVVNPYVFDFKKYHERRGIGASLILENAERTGVCSSIASKVIRAAYISREAVINRLKKHHEGRELGLISGMLTGYTQQIDDTTKEDFRITGLAHIMAVSGAHVVFVLLPFKFIIFRTVKRKKPRILLISIPALAYMFLTGLGASVIRAVFMLLILFFLDWNDIKISSMKILAACALIMLLIYPFYIYDVSFLMSFSATSGIILMHKRILDLPVIKTLPAFIAKTASVSAAAMLAAIPVMIVFFNRFSIISIITNIIFIPFTGILTTLSLLSLIPRAGDIIAPFLNHAASIFLAGVAFFADFKFSSMLFPLFGYCSLISYYLVLILGFIVKKRDLRSINYALFVLFVSITLHGYPMRTQINFLAAGNGDSILITSNNITMLIDGGDNRTSFGRYQLVPYLIKRGVFSVDIVIVTHSHRDHMDGIFDVLNEIKVKALIIPQVPDDSSYLELIKAAVSKGTAVYMVSENDRISLPYAIEINVLNPVRGKYYHNVNNESIVLLMDIYGFKVLLTGDAEKETELRLAGGLTKVDILKAGHHGSNTSSTPIFIEASSPALSVISAGKNTYGHPWPGVIQRLWEHGEVFITKYDGHLKFTFKDDIIYLDKFIK